MAVTNLEKDQASCHGKQIATFAIDAIEAANTTAIDIDDPSKGSIDIRVGFCNLGRFILVRGSNSGVEEERTKKKRKNAIITTTTNNNNNNNEEPQQAAAAATLLRNKNITDEVKNKTTTTTARRVQSHDNNDSQSKKYNKKESEKVGAMVSVSGNCT